jgi:hypothetical protein
VERVNLTNSLFLIRDIGDVCLLIGPVDGPDDLVDQLVHQTVCGDVGTDFDWGNDCPLIVEKQRSIVCTYSQTMLLVLMLCLLQWRWRESNPRPEKLTTNVYECR